MSRSQRARRRSALATVFALFLGTALLVPSSSAAASHRAQGGTLSITTTTTLTQDHQGPIVIGADHVALDCAGHSVASLAGQQGTGAGIAAFNRSDVAIRNCHVSGFAHGISLSAVDTFDVSGNTSTGNSGIGVVVMGSHGTVTGNIAAANGRNGFGVNGGGQSTDIRFKRNTADRNGDVGFMVFSPYPLVHYETGISFVSNVSTRNGDPGWATGGGFRVSEGNDGVTLADNEADGNVATGFYVRGADRVTLDDNAATTNTWNGFAVYDSSGDTVVRNVANDNPVGFFFYHLAGSTLSGNAASRNVESGFALYDSSDNSLTQNVANNNLGQYDEDGNSIGYGFYLRRAENTTLKRNTANGNGSVGFYILDVSTNNKLGLNVANHNAYFGFQLDIGAIANSVTRCTGHANGTADASDENPPLANSWSGNIFGTTDPGGLH
jgi:parallel beta-helix repeat protein